MKQNICVLGLGFVGAAMAVACAQAGRRKYGKPLYNVIGLDLDTPVGRERISKLNQGVFPLATNDRELVRLTAESRALGNLIATHDVEALRTADVVVVDIHFDIGDLSGKGRLQTGPFLDAIKMLGRLIPRGCLVVIETTVPPGTCQKVVKPALDRCAIERGLTEDAFLLAHAYERVMPGSSYLASIIDYWRVFASDSPVAADACERFLSTVVNVEDYPLTRLSSTLESETSKVLENSYRALTIAFMDEWGKFAERAGVDMYSVVEAIRKRPTHSNIRHPGFGVGGYCLTKDPLFAELAAKDILGLEDVDFPLSRLAMRINQDMPLHPLHKLRLRFGTLAGAKVLLAGISYRPDVADTRYSPSQTFYTLATDEGADVICSDPMVSYWSEVGIPVYESLESCVDLDLDAVVFAVPHRVYRDLDPVSWLRGRKLYVLDANNCLSESQRVGFTVAGCIIDSVGRGV